MTGIFDQSLFVFGEISVANKDGSGEFGQWELMSSSELIVEARDICPAINEGVGVNSFHSVQWYDDLQRDSHRFG